MTQARNRWLQIIIALGCALGLALALTACGEGSAEGERGGGATTTPSGPITVAVPSDPTNEGRALQLLQDQGLIQLNPDAGNAATVSDIIDNPNNIQIIETDAAAVPAMLDEVDFAIFNGNDATEANIDPATALASEDASSEDSSDSLDLYGGKRGSLEGLAVIN